MNGETVVSFCRIVIPRWVALCGLLVSAGTAPAEMPPPVVRLDHYAAQADGSFSFDLSWPALPGVLYQLQARPNFDPNSSWETFDLVQAGSTNGTYHGEARYPFSGTANDQQFFRVLPPQPGIFSLEPAFISLNGGTVYLFGQLLGTNASVRIGGLTIPASVITPGSTYSFTVAAGALSEGVYDVEILDGTNVIAMASKLFSVTGQPTPVGEAAQSMWEPPNQPPASPTFTSSSLMPALMKAKEKANRTKCQNNSRVFPPTGELQWQECDLWAAGRGLDFTWTRTYRSRTGTNTAMGQGWSHSYDVRAFLDAGGVVIVLDGAGRPDRYFPETNGFYTANELFNVFYFSNGVPTLEFPDTGKWEFNSLSNAVAPGQLSRIVDRNGNALTCVYDSGDGRLTQVIDTLGRTNSIAYDPFGHVLSVTDFSGRACTYSYWRNGQPGGSDGDLRSVTSPPVTGTPNGNDFPSGKTCLYTYTKGFPDERLNHNLLTGTDPLGQTWLSLAYSPVADPLDVTFDRVMSCTRGTDAPTMFTYTRRAPSSTNRWAVIEAVGNDPVGNVSIDWSDSLNRGVIHRDLAARAVPGVPISSSNLPTTKLRDSDPDFWETRFEWNADSLCTRVVYPGSNATEVVYQRGFNGTVAVPHQSRRSDGNARVVRELAYACDGSSGAGDCPPEMLVTRFDYDPRFGSPANNDAFNEGQEGLLLSTGKLTSPTSTDIGNLGKAIVKALAVTSPTDKDIGNLGKAIVKAIAVASPSAAIGAGYRIKQDIIINKPTAGSQLKQIGVTNHSNSRNQVSTATSLGKAINTKPLTGTANRSPVGTALGKAINTKPLTSTANRIDELGELAAERVFITSVTDPEGNRDNCSYDAKGNPIVLTHYGRLPDASDAPVENFEYNSFGQLAALVSAPDANGLRRRDEWTYYSSGAQNGYCSTWVIDATGPTVRTTSYQYDDAGNLALVTYPGGTQNKFHNNSLNQVVFMTEGSNSVCNPCSTAFSTSFYYDANDNLVRCEVENRDADGVLDSVKPTWTTLMTYDVLNQCRTIAHELTHVLQQGSAVSRYATNRFLYDGNGNVIEHDSPKAVASFSFNYSKIEYGYDTRDKVYTVTHAPGSTSSSTETFDYTANGRARRNTWGTGGGSAGVTTTYEYDRFDRCTAITDPMANVTTCAYDRNGNLVSQITFAETNDVPGSVSLFRYHEWRWVFDSLDRVTRESETLFDPLTQAPLLSGQATTVCTYAPNGTCTSITDPNGHTTRYAFDPSCRLTQITDAKTNMMNYVYDANDNVITCIQSDSSDLTPGKQTFITHHEYDVLDRRTVTYDNVGNTNRYAYDSRDNLTLLTDPRGAQTSFTYDGVNRRVRTDCCEAGAGLTFADYSYDDNGNLISSTDANTNTTRYAYDDLDRCVATTNADDTVELLVWSPRSNVILRTDPNGTSVSYTYDDNDRCVRKDITPGAGVASTTTFEMFVYNGMGECVMASNDVSMLDFGYDSRGCVLRSKQDCIAVAEAFDSAGNRASLTYPGGRLLNWTYDALDQISSVTTSPGGGLPSVSLMAFAYDGPGRPGRVTRGSNPVNTRLTWNGMQNPPNAAGDFGWQQISGINHQVAGGGAVIDRRSSSFDRNQNKVSRQQLPGPAVVSLTTNTFTYDALDRMTSFSRTGSDGGPQVKLFSLDGNGNRQSVSNDGVVSPYVMDNGTPEPADFQMDQYTITPFGPEQHDPNGNLVSAGTPASSTLYTYDYADRLVSVQQPGDKGGLITVMTCAYDAFGRRIGKTTFPPAPALPLTTAYILDPVTEEVLEEHENGVLKKTVVFPHVLETSGRIHITDNGQMFYSCVDELGNALALLDATGAVVELYDYDAYGAPTFLTPDSVPMVDSNGQLVTKSPNGNDQLFHGLWWDSEIGCFFEAWPNRWKGPELDAIKSGRYINPRTGRALTREARPGRNPQTGKSMYTAFDENPWSGAVQEGKKGLNAVNVKLARMMGDGGGMNPGTGKVRADKDKIAPRLVAAALLGSRMSEPKEISAPCPVFSPECRRTFSFPHVLETTGSKIHRTYTGGRFALDLD